MRDMFDSYTNLSNIYVPDNTTYRPSKFVTFDGEKVKEEYNIKGEFIGYSWCYGDTINLAISMSKKIKVEEDAIIYSIAGEKPSSSTIGIYGQRAYNVADIRSWTCRTLDQSNYVWVEDKLFTYPLDGVETITIKTFPDLDGKKVKFTIKNFREEEVFSVENVATSPFTVPIDKELSAKLLQGVYSCYISVLTESSISLCERFTVVVKDAQSSKDNLVSVIGDINV